MDDLIVVLTLHTNPDELECSEILLPPPYCIINCYVRIMRVQSVEFI